MTNIWREYKWHILTAAFVIGIGILLLFQNDNGVAKLSNWLFKKRVQILKDSLKDKKKSINKDEEKIKEIDEKLERLDKKEKEIDNASHDDLKSLSDEFVDLGL